MGRVREVLHVHLDLDGPFQGSNSHQLQKLHCTSSLHRFERDIVTEPELVAFCPSDDSAYSLYMHSKSELKTEFKYYRFAAHVVRSGISVGLLGPLWRGLQINCVDAYLGSETTLKN